MKNLLQSADARDESIEEQEAKNRVKKAIRRNANTRSQQGCRMRKKEGEIQSGVRGPDGKIIKVTKSPTHCPVFECTDP